MSNDKGNFNMADLTSALNEEGRADLVNVLKNKLQSLAGQHTEVLENLSPEVRKRVEELRLIQRYEIVNGPVEGDTNDAAMETEKGVPDFWLTAMKNNEVLAEEISGGLHSMILEGKKTVGETYYDILSINEDASYEEIRASYRAAILSFHPDKLKVANDDASSHHEGPDDRFLEAQKAWEILGSSSSRAIYDSKLRATRHELDVAEDIYLDDMTVEDNGDVVELFYQCRCGDYFFVDSLELGRMRYALCINAGKVFVKTTDASPASVVLPCGSCSLHVRVWITVGDKESIKD